MKEEIIQKACTFLFFTDIAKLQAEVETLKQQNERLGEEKAKSETEFGQKRAVFMDLFKQKEGKLVDTIITMLILNLSPSHQTFMSIMFNFMFES